MEWIDVRVVALVDLRAMGEHTDMVPASSSLHVDVGEPLHVLRKLVVLISLHTGHVSPSPPFSACESKSTCPFVCNRTPYTYLTEWHVSRGQPETWPVKAFCLGTAAVEARRLPSELDWLVCNAAP